MGGLLRLELPPPEPAGPAALAPAGPTDIADPAAPADPAADSSAGQLVNMIVYALPL